MSAGSLAVLTAMADELTGPLRLAVSGRIKQGKSTLVNALLGQRAAATDAGECTMIVTWFRYGFPERARLVLPDGEERELALIGGVLGGSLPLGVPAASSAMRIEAELSNAELRSLTIIDTPGFGSATPGVSQVSRDLLFDGTGAALQADAVLFVLDWRLVAEEVDMLAALSARFGSEYGLAVATLGVLNVRDVELPATEIEQRCAQHHAQLRAYLSEVVPLAALPAQTAGSGALTEADALAIGELARAPDEEVRRLLRDADRFRYAAGCLQPATRARLLDDLLGLSGIRFAVAAARDGCTGAVELSGALARQSGIAELRASLSTVIRANADALRAARALRRLQELVFQPAEPRDAGFLARLRDEAEELRLSPVMHRLDEREAQHAVAAGLVTLSEPWLSDLLRITGSGSVASRLGGHDGAPLRDLAAAGAARWREYAVSCGDVDRERIAGVAARSYELTYAALAAPWSAGTGAGVRRPGSAVGGPP